MSIFGSRIFVNAGTSSYEKSALRLKERGTAAHNTLEINGENSSEVWSSFRVAKRANPIGLNITKSSEFVSITCGHDGYMKFAGKPKHQRSWRLSPSELLVEDTVIGPYKSAIAFFHIHPALEISSVSKSKWTLSISGTNNRVHVEILQGKVTMNTDVFSPKFGVRNPGKTLAVSACSGGRTAVRVTWCTNE